MISLIKIYTLKILSQHIHMPPPQINTLNCLILESKMFLKYIPHESHIYYVNSKRRFMVYFKYYEQMIETMKVLTNHNVPYYRRQSLLPDRQEHQELVYHCNFRFKRIDLRRNIYHSTPYNEPKLFFDKYERAKVKYQQPIKRSDSKIALNETVQSINIEEKVVNLKPQSNSTGYQFKIEEVKMILENKEMLKNIFLNMGAL